MISDKDNLSLRAQCRLLELPRSGLYYEPVAVSEEELELRRRLDRLHTAHPYYGVRRMVAALGAEGLVVNVKRVRRLLREMGLEAVYPKPRLSVPGAGAAVHTDGTWEATDMPVEGDVPAFLVARSAAPSAPQTPTANASQASYKLPGTEVWEYKLSYEWRQDPQPAHDTPKRLVYGFNWKGTQGSGSLKNWFNDGHTTSLVANWGTTGDGVENELHRRRTRSNKERSPADGMVRRQLAVGAGSL